jgi:hypothetical protein
MKRITLDGPTIFNFKGKRYDFRAKKAYEVEDAVAKASYIAAHTVKIDGVPAAKTAAKAAAKSGAK